MFIHTTRKDPGLEDFRADVRAFCATELASSTRDKMQLGQHLDKTEHDAWLKVVGNRAG